jgi:hypothetical protein
MDGGSMLKVRLKHPAAFVLQLLCYFGAMLIMVPLLPHPEDRLLLWFFIVVLLHRMMGRMEWDITLIHEGREFRLGDEVYSLPGKPLFSGAVVGFLPDTPFTSLVVAVDERQMVVQPQLVRKAVL